MGKRSGVAHRDDELTAMSDQQIDDEIVRCKMRLRCSRAAKQSMAWKQRIHWLEAELARRA